MDIIKAKSLILLFMIFPWVSFSQTFFGIKTGYTISTVSFNPDNKSVLLPGQQLELGLVVKYFDAKYVGFQGEIYMTNRGYKAPYKETWNIKRVNNYIELPIFIQFNLDLSFVKLHVQAGPYASYLISAKEGYDSTGVWKMKDVKFNILRDNRFDYGLLGGIGLSHEFGRSVIQAEVRIGYGFADLYDYTYPNMPKESKAIVQSVNLCYLYNLSKKKKQ